MQYFSKYHIIYFWNQIYAAHIIYLFVLLELLLVLRLIIFSE
jgi:hypothetical protein